ncbi:hypothetical protein SAMN05216267_1013112 [Actinacidiphila rubida]|uniref:Uncharacterized protein n=2 Tax=Actinacidiphila rubida TaxID=310780 RepID=A0A1H8KN54_9ACTN|nr:hypothetical protein SAMN05216267_1013112 [Actinacidiphila rubida]
MESGSLKRITIVATAMVVLIGGLFLTVFRSGTGTAGARSADGRAATSGTAAARIDLEHRVTDFTASFGRDGGYRPPTEAERATVAGGVGLLLDHREQAARDRLAEVGFVLRTLTDSASGRRFAEIADSHEGGTGNRGWGRIYVDLSAPVHWSVQVPHPVADEDSEKLGVGVLRGTPGGVMVLAGAHRRSGEGNAADVAHRQDTVFDAVCAELVHRRLPGIQVHGFADSSQPGSDVIVSTGKADDARAEARALAAALTDHGFDVCRSWARDCSLEGRTNEQSGVAAAFHVPFLHVEFSRSVRSGDRRIARAVLAIDTVTARWDAAYGQGTITPASPSASARA